MPETSIRAFADNAADPKVRGYLHTPASANGSGVVLTHGAGSNAQAPLLVALAEAFSAAGFTVLRIDLPYRQARSFGPPGPGDAARDRAGLKNAILALKKICDDKMSDEQIGEQTIGNKNIGDAPLLAEVATSGNFGGQKAGRLFLGGHSYGGRQSSMLCADLSKEDPYLVSGLLCLSYPLHPPRKPDQQRTQHLPDLRTPTLFVSGTRDPFGSIAEIEQALKMIPARTKLLKIEGAGHDLGSKGKAKQEELTKKVLQEFQTLVGGLSD